MPKPLPHPVHWDQPFWDAALQGDLVVQVCNACDNKQHYPRPACINCLGADFRWQKLSGRGEIHSFTMVRVPRNPVFKDEAPIVFVDIQLDEGIRMISRLMESAESPIAIGDRVRIKFVKAENGDNVAALPCFELDS